MIRKLSVTESTYQCAIMHSICRIRLAHLSLDQHLQSQLAEARAAAQTNEWARQTMGTACMWRGPGCRRSYECLALLYGARAAYNKQRAHAVWQARNAWGKRKSVHSTFLPRENGPPQTGASASRLTSTRRFRWATPLVSWVRGLLSPSEVLK